MLATQLETVKRRDRMIYLFSPAEAVEFFCVDYNSANDGLTHVEAEYLEVIALR
ncbi:MAG TPA: hypothetical protein VL134_10855 [Leptolyngbya sp.]|jgi:hypothetical protein|nr:hypothetical protein [Leptolyngbya sp.]